MGGRIVLEPKTKEDAFSSHVMLGLKSIHYSLYLYVYVSEEGCNLGRYKPFMIIQSFFLEKQMTILVYNTATRSNAKLHPILPMPKARYMYNINLYQYIGIDLIGLLPTTSKVTLVDCFQQVA